jgi:molecular chaperone Hsp33
VSIAVDASRTRDALMPFVFEHAGIRGALVSLDATSRSILGSHDYPRPLARALAELLAASALLASSLKLDGSLIVQLSGDGPVRLLVVECSDALQLRGMAQWDGDRVHALPADASLADLAQGTTPGRLALTLDPRDGGALYQGIVSLDATSVAASIEHYLATSEQLHSRMWLRVLDGRVRGLLLQRLPSDDAHGDATWARVGVEADSGVRSALEQPDFAQVLQTLFVHDDLRIFDARPVTFRCKCSVARVANALRIAGRDEVEAALAERGVVEVTCEFCNRRYTFTPDDARALVAGADPESTASTGVIR